MVKTPIICYLTSPHKITLQTTILALVHSTAEYCTAVWCYASAL